MAGPRDQGARRERQAESFLRRRGLKALERNFHSRFGEIDLVMLHGPVLVFVEVRYRRSSRFGSGAETVTRAKQRRLVSTARHYLGCRRQHAHRPCRFDVVSMGGGTNGTEIDWIRDAFDSG